MPAAIKWWSASKFTCESLSIVFSVCWSKLEAASTAVRQAWMQILIGCQCKEDYKENDHLAWRSLWCCVSCSLNTSIHELLPLLHKVLKTIWKTVLMRGERSTCESQKVKVSVPYLWWGGRYDCSAKDREGTTILSSRLQILKTRYMLRKQRKKSRTTSRPAIFSVLRSSTGAALRTGLGLREACDYSVPSLASSN